MVKFDNEKPTNKIHDYVTWPSTTQIFEDGRGGLAFPEHNDSHCECDDYGHCTADEGKPVSLDLELNVSTSATTVTDDEISYRPSYNVNIHTPGKINFRASAITTYKPDPNDGVVQTYDYDGVIQTYDSFSLDQDTTARLVAYTADSLELTKLVNRDILIKNGDQAGHYVFSFVDSSDKPEYRYDWNTHVSFDIEIDLVLDNDIYVYLTNQDNPAENGVYRYTPTGSIIKVATAPVRDEIDPDTLLSDSTVLDNVPYCDHFRKSYSHKEVHDWLDDTVGEVTKFGVHSTSLKDCKGGFVDWFTTDGLVNIGNGHESVFVNGFGLGAMYKNSVSETKEDTTKLPTDSFDEYDGTRYPVLTWAYGTRYDARTENNTAALPRDWPFTHITGTQQRPVFNRLNDTNNITLVKHCQGYIDGQLYNLGNLEFERTIIDPSNPDDPNPSHEHVFYNKHHIVLYPDFRSVPSNNPYSYGDNAVVVKPTFIHIPASLDTKDGETVDITVSIQNVDQDAFGTPGTAAALSGYYAAMSQPRVYVMGGVQKFSNKKLLVAVSASNNSYTLHSDRPAYDDKGTTLLDQGTNVRANVVIGPADGIGDRRTFSAHGYILSNNDQNGVTIQVDNQVFPYDTTSIEWLKKKVMICGMAYLENGDNPSDTPLGLVSRNQSMMYNDATIRNTRDGELDQYNKFYAIKNNDDRATLEHVDKRYVLATVYQNTTSTFPWALTNRRKMAHLERTWTDELHRKRGELNPLMKMVYDQNHDMYNKFNGSFTSIKLTPEMNPVSYETSSDWKTLASVIRVKLPEQFAADPVTSACGNPVRQAQKAYGDLINDFKKMRLRSYTGRGKAMVHVNGWSLSNVEWPDPGDSLDDSITIEQATSTVNLHNSVWCCNVRSLPDYVIKADMMDSANKKPIVVDSLIVGDDTNASWIQYVRDAHFPYNKTIDDTKASACVAETETTVVGIPEVYRRYSSNSLVETYASSGKISLVDDRRMLNDMRRYAETVLACNLDEPTYMTLSCGDNLINGTFENDAIERLCRDWMFPFTNIQSIDSVPVPKIDNIANLLTAHQRAYVAADAVQSYRYEYADSDDPNVNDTIATVSSVLPTDTELAKFLESYVAAYGAKMDKHQYQGTRVMLQNGQFPNATSSIYINKIDRVRRRLGYTNDDPMRNLGYYLNDNFANIGAATRDPNVDRTIIQDADDSSGEHSYALSMSMPPYVTQNITDGNVRRPKYMNETYTRVIMQFTFSQKAGRWYTTGYRQHPTTYFSPLYGSDALATTSNSLYTVKGNNTYMIDPATHTMKLNPEYVTVENKANIRPLWRNSACSGFTTYQDHMYSLYSDVPPMDITLGCVPFLRYVNNGSTTCVYNMSDESETELVGNLNGEYNQFADGSVLRPLQRLEEPWKDEFNGGINLYPPANLWGANKGINQGPNDPPLTDAGVHANFWSVRKFIRPAVTALAGTDVPGKDADLDPEQTPQPSHTGGKFSDPTLYRMFDFPISGEVIYKLPNEMDPEDDMAKQSLLYHVNNYEDILVGKTPQDVILGYGLSDDEQEIDP